MPSQGEYVEDLYTQARFISEKRFSQLSCCVVKGVSPLCSVLYPLGRMTLQRASQAKLLRHVSVEDCPVSAAAHTCLFSKRRTI